MFQCDVRQKMLCHHKGEDYPSNLMVYFIECIELAHKTESPIENLRSIGLIFYTHYFIINLKIFSNIMMIPSAHIKKLLAYHQCTIIHDIKLEKIQVKEVHDTKKWTFCTYGKANDSRYLLNALTQLNILIDQRSDLFEEEQKNNPSVSQDAGTGFTFFSLPSIFSISDMKKPNHLNNDSKIFISNGSMHRIRPKESIKLGSVPQLNSNSFWPCPKAKTKTTTEKT